MAPVAGRVADGKKDWLVFLLGFLKSLIAPGMPIDRVIGVLEEIRRTFREAVRLKLCRRCCGMQGTSVDEEWIVVVYAVTVSMIKMAVAVQGKAQPPILDPAFNDPVDGCRGANDENVQLSTFLPSNRAIETKGCRRTGSGAIRQRERGQKRLGNGFFSAVSSPSA